MAIETSEWLNPVRDDAPTGDDVSFSDVFDKIREARRSDDPDLPQGDWEHELKAANWREVIKLAGSVLAEQSKDLQAAVWLGEALIAQHELDGAHGACELLAELMDRYWDEMYPRVEDDDLDERAGKLAWFNDYAAQAVSAVPLAPGDPPYTLLDWHVSREVDNLSRQNAEAFQEAVGEGKPTGEIFDKAVESAPDAKLREQYELSIRAGAAFERFKDVCDARLGVAGPLAPGPPADTLRDWEVSRGVGNVAGQSAEAFQEAVGEDKPTGEIFDKAVESAPDAKRREQYELSIRAVAAFERFKAVCDARLGVAGPSLNTLQEALKRIVPILGKAARAKGLIGAEEADEALGEGGAGGDGASAGAVDRGENGSESWRGRECPDV